MTTLDRKTVEILASETLKLLNKEKESGKAPRKMSEIVVEVLNPYPRYVSSESISEICSYVSKMRKNTAGKKKQPAKKKHPRAKRSIVTDAMLEGAEEAERQHKENLSDDY